jgi:Zn-dependent protease
MLRHALGVRLPGTPLILGPSWLLVLPVGVWAAATYYIPVLGPFLREEEGWLVAVGAVLLIVLSVAVHGLAHLAAARLTGSRSPERVPLYPLGDAAQRWPAAPDAWSEALAAMAGPLANALVALGVYVIWDRHLHPMLNAGLPLVILTNALIVAVNLAPGFPLDGGRLARAAVWGLLRRPDLATPAGRGLGWLAGAALVAWGIGLLVQPARFSLETGAGTLLVAGLLGVAMWSPASPVTRAVPPTHLPAWAIGPRLLLLVALLERGEPMTLDDVAARFAAAGVALTAADALASLKRCKPARAPIYRDGDRYALDPHDDEVSFWLFRLGLRPARVPLLKAMGPGPSPMPSPGDPVTVASLNEAWRDGVPNTWSAQRVAVAVLDAHDGAMSGTDFWSERMRVRSNGVYITTRSAPAVAASIARASSGRASCGPSAR